MDQDKLSAAKLAAEELSLEDLRALRQWITLEQEPKLEAAPFVAQEQARIMRELREAGAAPRPEAASVNGAESAFADVDRETGLGKIPAWVNPEGKAVNMYEEGDVVTRKGAVFVSTLAGLNGDEPGQDSTWEEITERLSPTPAPEGDE